MSKIQYHPLKVAQVIEETADARSLVFEIPAELKDLFKYKPGQFLTLRVPCGARPLPRCYSLSSTPTEDEPLRVTVKRVAGGRASNWLCGCLRAGDTLDVAVPAGIFTPKSYDGDFLLFGGGSGVTPVLSIIRSVLNNGKGRMRLFYANRDERSVIFAAELAKLSREHPKRLQVIHWLDSVQGIPSQAQIEALALGWENAQAFICGPGIFMDTTAAALHGVGFPSSRVHIERFVSLPEESDELPVAVAVEGGTVSQVEVELDGETHRFEAQAGELLIDAMEKAGMQPPYSCRAGACAACMCHLDDGEVEMMSNQVLEQSDIAQGWILSCQAVAKSPVVKLRYPT
ncbi:3-ketosteroid-9-alpha-hydroxylase [Solimonas sp. K1W22B-7]|uniref:ferredoxin--NADP reductase n=1 Tax=Solimonas sp. K1W22B-7 TaxID=2303331 RepID=UPI000E32FED9|nr:ferredoxin--NADP reductase [Solimonas sp. K1W22B-7]AXQ28118.1 3-ketosteroid-9-alpha-hydroxylase [Solimonas sp. K1W22B-7]